MLFVFTVWLRLRNEAYFAVTARRVLEVCIASVEDALAAAAGGADRLELNSALELDGLTPSLGLFREVRQAVPLPIIAMVRCRGGDFCYSDYERRVMLRDAEMLLEAGVSGIACGGLLRDGRLDRLFWEEISKITGTRELVFHRAFDCASQPETSLEELIELGTTRLLTSGGRPTAREGAETIARLRRQAQGRIQLLPGAGVSPENIAELLQITGCTQVHGTFRHIHPQSAAAGPATSGPRTDATRVAAARQQLDYVGESKAWNKIRQQ
jgi:copper homeostasis protein